MQSLGFYRAFEDRYRGSRELIKGRLTQYNPFLAQLLKSFATCTALDIGCGRGEWLELLTEQGFNAAGVDLDQGMLQACTNLGLNVAHADGVAYLQQLPEESLHLITAFHVVEHISFEQLQSLVKAALSALVPGGLLILETPNPESLAVASSEFYLDPTHIKPIPPQLLGFVTEYAGFTRNKIARFQEPAGLSQKADITFTELVYGVSPDYAIIAQKPASTLILQGFDAVFAHQYGVDLKTLLWRIEQQQTRLREEQAQNTQHQFMELQVEQAALKHFQHLVTTSYTWKLQAPLRWLQPKIHHGRKTVSCKLQSAFLNKIPSKAKVTITLKNQIKRGLMAVYQRIQKHPKIQNKIITALARFPRLTNMLRRLLHPSPSGVHMPQNSEVSQLSLRGMQILEQMQDQAKRKPLNLIHIKKELS